MVSYPNMTSEIDATVKELRENLILPKRNIDFNMISKKYYTVKMEYKIGVLKYDNPHIYMF